MDKTTGSTGGPTCDSLKASSGCAAPPTPAPTPAPPLSTSSSVPSCDFESSCSGWQSTGQHKWKVRSGSTPSGGTGPTGDHTTGAGQYTYVESSRPNSPNKDFILESAPVALSSDASVSFWYSMGGAAMGTMILEAKSNGAFKQIWTKSGNQGVNWQQASVDIGSDVTGLRFKATTGLSWSSDFALDDITSSAKATPLPTSQPTYAPTATPASQQLPVVAAASNLTQGVEDSLDGVAAAVPETTQDVKKAKRALRNAKGALQNLGTALKSVATSGAAAGSLAQLIRPGRRPITATTNDDDDDEVEHPSGDCSELQGAARKFCVKRELAHRSRIDPSVRIVGAEATRDHEISISITDPAPSVSEYQYVQFTSDQLRSPKDAIILVPADAACDESLEMRTLRKVLVPPINPLARSTDTFGVIAMHLNPDASPDAIQRTSIQSIDPGAYKLAYVRELATLPEEKYVFSEVFQVQAGLPSRPGKVTVRKQGEQVQLSWKPSLFNGGAAAVFYEVQYCRPVGAEGRNCDWTPLGTDPRAGTSLTLARLPDGCSSGCTFRSIAINEHGYSKPGYVVV